MTRSETAANKIMKLFTDESRGKAIQFTDLSYTTRLLMSTNIQHILQELYGVKIEQPELMLRMKNGA